MLFPSNMKKHLKLLKINIQGIRILSSMILAWMREALKKIKFTLDNPVTATILEEEIHLCMMLRKNKLSGEEKDSSNSLILVSRHWKPLQKMILWVWVRRTKTIIIVYLEKLKMYFLAMKNSNLKIKQKCMFIGLIKQMVKMLKYLTLLPLMNGLFLQKMFPSFSKNLKR